MVVIGTSKSGRQQLSTRELRSASIEQSGRSSATRSPRNRVVTWLTEELDSSITWPTSATKFSAVTTRAWPTASPPSAESAPGVFSNRVSQKRTASDLNDRQVAFALTAPIDPDRRHQPERSFIAGQR